MIKELIESEHSKKQTMKIVRLVGNHQKKFDELISLCFGDNEKLAQRASWSVSYCILRNPSLLNKHLGKVIHELKAGRHNAIRRNFLKSLPEVEIPKKFDPEIITISFDLMNKKDEPVAVKVYAMYLLEKYLDKYPDLSDELKSSIEEQMPYGTAGFRACGKKILKGLKNKTVNINH